MSRGANDTTGIEKKEQLTSEMLKNIQSPASIHQKLISNIIETTKVAFDGDIGYINAKDFQL